MYIKAARNDRNITAIFFLFSHWINKTRKAEVNGKQITPTKRWQFQTLVSKSGTDGMFVKCFCATTPHIESQICVCRP